MSGKSTRCVSRLLLPQSGGIRQPLRRHRLSSCVPAFGC